MVEGGADDVVLDGENGSFQNQSEEASSSKRSSRRASVEAISAWAELKKKRKSPRENRTTGDQRDQRAEKRKRRSKLTIKDASTDQLDAMSEFMPDLTDSDAKILALRMGVQAQDKVSRKEPFPPSKTTSSAPPSAIIASIIY